MVCWAGIRERLGGRFEGGRVSVDVGSAVGVGLGTGVGVLIGVEVGGCGLPVWEGVGARVGVSVRAGISGGRNGTYRRCPARMVVESPRQLANCNSETLTPNLNPRLKSVSPGRIV